MRTPIAHCLAWPERIDSGVEPLDIIEVAKLEFEKPDLNRFPCLRLCYEAMRAGGSATIALNAANEVAVDAFLQHKISFIAIADLIEKVLGEIKQQQVSTIDEILEVDASARELATSWLSRMQTV
jgi:1-deoxy-D-xylulose-5-phosphate reductoisomerase